MRTVALVVVWVAVFALINYVGASVSGISSVGDLTVADAIYGGVGGAAGAAAVARFVDRNLLGRRRSSQSGEGAVLRQAGHPLAGKHLEAAAGFMAAEKWSQAIEEFDGAVRVEPNLGIAHNNRGIANRKLGQLDQAIADYSKAIELDPTAAALAHYNRGLAFEELGDRHKAVADYSSAIGLDPNYADAYINRGLAHVELQDVHQAIADLERGASLISDRRRRSAIKDRVVDLRARLGADS